ncbi:3085_t:CDS:1 [Cetraspora pellucida]|uniref:3085_t:CDS:1 n=1 Tax=Cetraspora pellucida TaxID=1433469 RepID=A0A9N9D9N4_9GLOM|nr:3085_t:CDS:1 [Cetraspora pellucida]
MSSTNTATDTSDSTSQSSSPIVIIIIVVAIVGLIAGVAVILYFNFQRKKKKRDNKLKPLMLASSRVEPHPHKNTTRGISDVTSHVQKKHDVPSVVFEVPESEKYGIHEKVITEEDSLRSPPLVREGPGGLRRTPTRSMTMPMPSRGGEEFSSSEEEYDDDGDDDEEAYTGVSQQHYTHSGET